MLIEQLKNFDANRASIDELIELASLGRIIHAEYDARDVEAPEWLNVQIKSLGNEITAKTRDRDEARLRELQARQDTLKTTAEKKVENAREIARLNKRLGRG